MELALLLLRELWDGEEIGGRTKSAGFDASSVTPSICRRTTFSAALDGLSGLGVSFIVFTALSGCTLCFFTFFEATRWAGGDGQVLEGLLDCVTCCDLMAAFWLSLCARAVIEDKGLEGFGEDIRVRVRRGIFRGLVLV